MATYEESLVRVRARAEQVWPASVVDDWLFGSNAFLNGARPIDVLKLRGPDEVLTALDVAEAGGYA